MDHTDRLRRALIVHDSGTFRAPKKTFKKRPKPLDTVADVVIVGHRSAKGWPCGMFENLKGKKMFEVSKLIVIAEHWQRQGHASKAELLFLVAKELARLQRGGK